MKEALNVVAIPPYCSGQFQDPHSCSRSMFSSRPRSSSQSHRTAQGNSKRIRELPREILPGSKSQSHRTAQGNSKRRSGGSPRRHGLRRSQSHRTAQGNSKTMTAIRNAAQRYLVAIPPYCSGQFQVLRTKVVQVGLRFKEKSQSHRTAQGNSKGTRSNLLILAHLTPAKVRPPKTRPRAACVTVIPCLLISIQLSHST